MQCGWCDTMEAWHVLRAHEVCTMHAALGRNPRWCAMDPEDLAYYIEAEAMAVRWVLLTGGEPGLYDLRPLMAELRRLHYQVAIETSGVGEGVTVAGADHVTYSPKPGAPGWQGPAPAFLEALVAAPSCELKWIVGTAEDLVALREFRAAYAILRKVPVCLQPLSRNQQATKLCTDAVLSLGWRLSIQVHKWLDLP